MQTVNVICYIQVGQKKPDHFLKCMTPVYGEVGRRSAYQNVELFIRSKSNIQNVAIYSPVCFYFWCVCF